MLRTALLFGTVLGILALVWVVLLMVTGSNPYGPRRLMTTPLVPFVVIGSQWFVRRYYPTGPGIGKAILTGLLTAVFASVVSAVTLYGFARSADPRLLERNAEEATKILQSARSYYLKQPGGVERYKLDQQNIARTPQELAQDELSKKLILGLLFAIPGGIFLRK
ncbi:DUF4199 domain-containing protein [Hymenobacter crusticola]|uniref:DUF4199 domain-containing protein n=1 Tax=Hymenobacter crusticola TaxID=1770526 RepID=UPI001C4FEB39|nr:DUF4199 domain-containing protein [Hymenobacter crusticola]